MTKKLRVVKTVSGLQKILKKIKGNKTIGFVPTMGALHDGHASLISKSVGKCDVTVCSIFVNPTQFNDASDLKKYPRTLQSDVRLLKKAKCDIVFAPTAEEVYPKEKNTKLKLRLGIMDKVMEGKFRPGHFKGVAQVVKRLLDIVDPDKLFMGQKDFQQFTIIATMIKQLNIETELVVCPTKREASGLAMSSRNRRLSPDIKSRSKILFETLLEARELLKLGYSANHISKYAMDAMSIKDFKPEYFDVVDGHTLKKVKSAKNLDYIVACTAVWAGDVRLIDNLCLRP